jgi:hypothetical protein
MRPQMLEARHPEGVLEAGNACMQGVLQFGPGARILYARGEQHTRDDRLRVIGAEWLRKVCQLEASVDCFLQQPEGGHAAQYAVEWVAQDACDGRKIVSRTGPVGEIIG